MDAEFFEANITKQKNILIPYQIHIMVDPINTNKHWISIALLVEV